VAFEVYPKHKSSAKTPCEKIKQHTGLLRAKSTVASQTKKHGMVSPTLGLMHAKKITETIIYAVYKSMDRSATRRGISYPSEGALKQTNKPFPPTHGCMNFRLRYAAAAVDSAAETSPSSGPMVIRVICRFVMGSLGRRRTHSTKASHSHGRAVLPFKATGHLNSSTGVSVMGHTASCGPV
jgi:hypothetical protein